MKPQVVKTEGDQPRIEFEIMEPKADTDVSSGTVTRAKATCLACGSVLPPARVRAQLTQQRGGADVVFGAVGHRAGGARLFMASNAYEARRARATIPPASGTSLRGCAQGTHAALRRCLKKNGKLGGKKRVSSPVPDEPLPLMSSTFNVPLYGAWIDWGAICSPQGRRQHSWSWVRS